MSAALEFRAVSKRFGPELRVLAGASFSLGAGEVVVLSGENGAGKTTCFDLASGLATPDAGEVRLGGRPTRGLSPEALARRGLRRMYQTPAVFPSLSVRDNVLVGLRPGWHSLPVPWPFEGARERLWRRVLSAAPALGEACPFLAGHAGPVADLSFGQRRVVEFLRTHAAVGSGGVRAVLLDEPFAGVHASVVPVMWGMIGGWAEGGTAVMLIEHLDAGGVAAGCRRLRLAAGVVS